ncbi:unnamed protein product, partial [Phaeothamnion confervicola]
AQRLYRKLLNDYERWGDIDSPIDVILRQAAFFVLPHESFADANASNEESAAKAAAAVSSFYGGTGGSGIDSDGDSRSGAAAFKLENFRKFVTELIYLGSTHGAAPAGGLAPIGADGIAALHCGAAVAASGVLSTDRGSSRGGGDEKAENPAAVLLRRRLQRAREAAVPLVVRLTADGASAARHVSGAALAKYGVPPAMAEQVERILAVLVARSVAA